MTKKGVKKCNYLKQNTLLSFMCMESLVESDILKGKTTKKRRDETSPDGYTPLSAYS